MNLSDRYTEIVNDYVKAFCKKQEIDVEDLEWIANDVGGIAYVADCCFGFDDIRYDVDNNLKEGLIFKWFWYNVENEQNVNLKNYHKYYKGFKN